MNTKIASMYSFTIKNFAFFKYGVIFFKFVDDCFNKFKIVLSQEEKMTRDIITN